MIIAYWPIIQSCSCLLSLGFVNSYLTVFEISAKQKENLSKLAKEK